MNASTLITEKLLLSTPKIYKGFNSKFSFFEPFEGSLQRSFYNEMPTGLLPTSIGNYRKRYV